MRYGTIPIALVVAALALAACGGDDGGGGSSASSSGGSSGDSKLAKFSQCMRENGVPDFPDPVNGQLVLRGKPGDDLNPESPQFQSAQEACQKFSPSAEQGEAASGEMQQQALAFAACMRENGVPKFPDPSFSGAGVKMKLPQGLSPESPQFQNAQRACQDKNPIGGDKP